VLTAFQKHVLAIIARNRSPESLVGGGATLNRSRPRRSRDLDIFHDAIRNVEASAGRDVELLRSSGMKVDIVSRFTGGRIEAIVRGTNGEDVTLVDWTTESAFRFFPAIRDPEFGWRLHDADLAVNKMLAMAGRQEARDFVDVMDLHGRGFPIAALAWAAPAKDPGFTPYLILEEISRNSRIDPRHLVAETLGVAKIDPVAMKRSLLAAIREARGLFDRLPPDQMGALYLDDGMHIAVPDPAAVRSGRLHLHRASLRGAWPSIPGVEPMPPKIGSSPKRRR
jgi:hypothetical protein